MDGCLFSFFFRSILFLKEKRILSYNRASPNQKSESKDMKNYATDDKWSVDGKTFLVFVEHDFFVTLFRYEGIWDEDVSRKFLIDDTKKKKRQSKYNVDIYYNVIVSLICSKLMIQKIFIFLIKMRQKWFI